MSIFFEICSNINTNFGFQNFSGHTVLPCRMVNNLLNETFEVFTQWSLDFDVGGKSGNHLPWFFFPGKLTNDIINNKLLSKCTFSERHWERNWACESDFPLSVPDSSLVRNALFSAKNARLGFTFSTTLRYLQLGTKKWNLLYSYLSKQRTLGQIWRHLFGKVD